MIKVYLNNVKTQQVSPPNTFAGATCRVLGCTFVLRDLSGEINVLMPEKLASDALKVLRLEQDDRPQTTGDWKRISRQVW